MSEEHLYFGEIDTVLFYQANLSCQHVFSLHQQEYLVFFFLLIGSLLDLRTRKGLCIAAVPFALLASSIVRDVNR